MDCIGRLPQPFLQVPVAASSRPDSNIICIDAMLDSWDSLQEWRQLDNGDVEDEGRQYRSLWCALTSHMYELRFQSSQGETRRAMRQIL